MRKELLLVLLLLSTVTLIKLPWIAGNNQVSADSESVATLTHWSRLQSGQVDYNLDAHSGHLPLSTITGAMISRLIPQPVSLKALQLISLVTGLVLLIMAWITLRTLCPVSGGMNWYALAVLLILAVNPMIMFFGGIGFSMHMAGLVLLLCAVLLFQYASRAGAKGVAPLLSAIIAGVLSGLLAGFHWWGLLVMPFAALFCIRFAGKSRSLVAGAAVTLLTGAGSILFSLQMIGSGSIQAGLSRSVSSLFPGGSDMLPSGSFAVPFLLYCLPVIILTGMVIIKFVTSPLPSVKPGRNFLNMFPVDQWPLVAMCTTPAILSFFTGKGFYSIYPAMFLFPITAFSMTAGVILHKSVTLEKGRLTGGVVTIALLVIAVVWSVHRFIAMVT
jgi:hypothetical protein